MHVCEHGQQPKKTDPEMCDGMRIEYVVIVVAFFAKSSFQYGARTRNNEYLEWEILLFQFHFFDITKIIEPNRHISIFSMTRRADNMVVSNVRPLNDYRVIIIVMWREERSRQELYVR